MCGIAGFLFGQALRYRPESVLAAMTTALRHRGPDGNGAWVDCADGVALGHRRLAIIDLTESGRQPMRSHSGRYVITFNGEIYNFPDLRRELELLGTRFNGDSDTEVLLAAFDAWGVNDAIRRTIGMFAFAVWDRESRELTLGRDRLGKKPIYYGMVAGHLVFGSELKALRAFPGLSRTIDRGALTQLMRHSYVPAPRSIYAGIAKLPPASMVVCRRVRNDIQVSEPAPYWRVPEQNVGAVVPCGSVTESLGELERLLSSAVRMRMTADVPIGSFLSGGIDSSLVSALMQAQSSRAIKTFSIGFEEKAYDEAPYARQVARHLGTDHTEVYVSSRDALSVIPQLPEIYDEPFSDSSQIPTYLVSQIARRNVVVSLSGDGGDELFCGYPRYHRFRTIWQNMRRLPRSLRNSGATVIRWLPASKWDRLLRPVARMIPVLRSVRSPGDKMHKVAEMLGSESPEAVYLRFLSHWNPPTQVVRDAREPDNPILNVTGKLDVDEFTPEMMRIDLENYLPNDILVKVDRASMAVSLEVRSPLLDHRVVEFAGSLPLSMKVVEGRDKWPLRELLCRYVPSALIDRPKKGFGIPVEGWLRGPLREWAEDLLDKRRMSQEGLLNSDVIRAVWEGFLAGTNVEHFLLWDVLMFQAWLNLERDASCKAPAAMLETA